MPTLLPAQVSFVCLFVYAWLSARRSRGLTGVICHSRGLWEPRYAVTDQNPFSLRDNLNFKLHQQENLLSTRFLCSFVLNRFTPPPKLFYEVLSIMFPWINVFASLQLLSYLKLFSRCFHLRVRHLHYVCQTPPTPSISVFSSAPPSAPVSLTWEYESGDGGVSLRWRPPVDMGGRSEVWYGVVCRICPSPTFANPSSCSWCGEGVTFSPSQTNLKQTKVTLNNLLTRVTYLIQVLLEKSWIHIINGFEIITDLWSFSWTHRWDGSTVLYYYIILYDKCRISKYTLPFII